MLDWIKYLKYHFVPCLLLVRRDAHIMFRLYLIPEYKCDITFSAAAQPISYIMLLDERNAHNR